MAKLGTQPKFFTAFNRLETVATAGRLLVPRLGLRFKEPVTLPP